MIQMIRENADSSDTLEYLRSFAFSLARGLDDISVVSWDDIAGICDSGIIHLKLTIPNR
jgi:hypothetical protein